MFEWYYRLEDVFQELSVDEELSFTFSYIIVAVLGAVNGLMAGVLL